jgi:hypothetical protein
VAPLNTVPLTEPVGNEDPVLKNVVEGVSSLPPVLAGTPYAITKYIVFGFRWSVKVIVFRSPLYDCPTIVSRFIRNDFSPETSAVSIALLNVIWNVVERGTFRVFVAGLVDTTWNCASATAENTSNKPTHNDFIGISSWMNRN